MPIPDVGNGYLLTVQDSLGNFIVLAGQRGLDITRTRNQIDASSKNDDHMINRVGRQSSNITLNQAFVFDDQADALLETAFESRTELSIQKLREGVVVKEATVLIISMDEGHPDEDVSTRSITMAVQAPGWTNP
jgi:predicted secreted protein